MSITREWLHVHFFLEVSIKESILHIHLIKRPMANDSHSNEISDRCKTSTRLELCSFMRRKRDKTSTTKNPKRGVIRSLTIEKLKW